MHKLIIIFIFAAFGFLNAQINNLEKRNISPKTEYQSDSSIDVKYYKLDISIDPGNKYLTGLVTIKAKLLKNISQNYLDLSGNMHVDTITSNGKVMPFTRANDKIVFSPNVNVGEEFTIVIKYEGSPAATGMGSFVFSSYSTFPHIWSLSEPYGAKDWWPCKDTPADKADSIDIWVTVPSELIAVSNGLLTGTLNLGSEKTQYRWHSNYPIATYLVAVTISQFEKYSGTFNYNNKSMPIDNYVMQDQLNSIKSGLDLTPEMLRIFSDKYGEYPFIKEKYGTVYFGWGGGMEHQTISSVTGYDEDLLSHELSHQWFGDKVTCKTWSDIWLNEGFATFSAGLYFENKYGKETYSNYIKSLGYDAINAKGSIYIQDVSDVNNIFNWQNTYAKGAVVVHMLRGILGDSLFFASLQNYLNKYAYSSATIEDFKNVIDSTAKQDLSYFFNEWIYGEGFPIYYFSWSSQKEGAKYLTSLNIEQSLMNNKNYFIMPIQLQLKFKNKDSLITVFNDSLIQHFNISTEEMPYSVIFDPNDLILKNVVNNNEDVIKDFTLYQNYPNPFNGNTTIVFLVSKMSKIQLIIYDILGREIEKLVNKELFPGVYNVQLDGQKLDSGVYIYVLKAGNTVLSKKMVILR